MALLQNLWAGKMQQNKILKSIAQLRCNLPFLRALLVWSAYIQLVMLHLFLSIFLIYPSSLTRSLFDTICYLQHGLAILLG